MALGDTAGLLFKIRSDSSDAQADLNKLKTGISSVEGAAGALPAPLAIAAVAITAVATASVAAAIGLFNLAKEASDYGSQIFDASQKTGLTAATLTALKLAADTSGSSFQEITGSVGKFNILIGQAAQGNEKASDILKKYGITAKDTNGALAQAVDIINKQTSADQKAVAVKELFKDRTGALIPVISTMTEGLNKQVEAAKRLGVTLTESDIKAADEFGDTLDLLSTQAKAMATKFALQYAPQITAAMQSISEFLSKNAASAVYWGQTVGSAITATIKTIQLQVENARGAISVLAYLAAGDPISAARALGITYGNIQGVLDASGQPVPTTSAPTPVGPNLEDIEAQKKAADEAQKKAADEARKAREEARKKELAGLISYNQEKLKYEQIAYEEEQKLLEKSLIASNQSLEARQKFGRDSTENLQEYYNNVKRILDEGLKLDLVGKVGSEIEAANAKYKTALASLDTDVAKSADDANKLIVNTWKKQSEAYLKIAQETAEQQIKLTDFTTASLLSSYQKDLAQHKLTADQFAIYEDNLAIVQLKKKQAILTTELAAVKGNGEAEKRVNEELAAVIAALFVAENKRNENAAKRGAENIEKLKKEKEAADELRQAMEQFADEQQKAYEEEKKRAKERTLQQTVGSGREISAISQLQNYFASEGNTAAIAGIDAMSQAFHGLGEALGQVISAWVLYGSAGTSVRKVTAQILAGIAQQAAVKAVFELAEGFAALALAFFGLPNAGPSATAHFVAAGIYAGIAGIAAISGRAVAGNAFKDQSATSASSASSSGQGSAKGGAYSGRPDQIIDQSITAPAQRGFEIVVTNKSGALFDIFNFEVRNSGKLRQLIKSTANG